MQAGEGVSVRALNFKQLHNMLSCTGDKKLNEVRLCLEGIMYMVHPVHNGVYTRDWLYPFS